MVIRGQECVCTHSKNRECVSSLRERVPAVGPRLNSMSLGEHSPYKGTWCRNCELGRNVSYFQWLSTNLSKEEPKQRTECRWKKEKVLESGDLQTSLRLPTVTLGDSELQSTDPGPSSIICRVDQVIYKFNFSFTVLSCLLFCHAWLLVQQCYKRINKEYLGHSWESSWAGCESFLN